MDPITVYYDGETRNVIFDESSLNRTLEITDPSTGETTVVDKVPFHIGVPPGVPVNDQAIAELLSSARRMMDYQKDSKAMYVIVDIGWTP